MSQFTARLSCFLCELTVRRTGVNRWVNGNRLRQALAESAKSGVIPFQSLMKFWRVRKQLAAAWPVVCITQKREEQVADSKSESTRKGGHHENQDKCKSRNQDHVRAIDESEIKRLRGQKVELPNQKGKEDAMKTKTNVKAGLRVQTC
jgi:hypothetical protein